MLRRNFRLFSRLMIVVLTVLMLSPGRHASASGPIPNTPVPDCQNGFLPDDIWTYCGMEHTGGYDRIAFIQDIHPSGSDYHHNFHLRHWDWNSGVWADDANWHIYFDGVVDNGFYGPTYNFRVWDNVNNAPQKIFPISLADCPSGPGDIYLCASNAADNFTDYFYQGDVATYYPDLRTALVTKNPGKWGTLRNAFCNVVHQKHVNLGWNADCIVR